MSGISESARRRRKLFLVLVGISCASATFFGVIAGVAVFAKQPMHGAAFGFAAALLPAILISGLIAGTEIYLPRTRAGRMLERAPFLATLALKSLVYTALVILVLGSKVARWIAAYAVFGHAAAADVYRWEPFPIAISIAIVLLLLPTLVMMLQMAGLVGGSTLISIALGRYHRSRLEERFFLFIDIVGSTPIAERLGPASVHQFLSRVFQVASDPIDDHAGDVYQYVGDEVVVTWTLAQGRQGARPVACHFAVQRALEDAAPEFEREFGAVPQLRAALHAGPVITGEVGGSRRSIVFHGDVMNTTSRIENATRDLKRPFLASEDAVRRLEGMENYALEDLGPQQLRGRAAPVRVYAVSAAGTARIPGAAA